MGKRIAIILAIALALAGALFVGVKAEVIRPNMIFVPKGTQGVDISEHQGAVDVGALANEGISFVYAKATEGSTYIDSEFQSTCEAVAGGRLPLGAYHFFSFDSPGDQQATSFIAAARRAWDDPSIQSLVPAVDLELYGDKKQNPPAAEGVRRELGAFIEAVEAACGKKPLIYAGNDIYDRYLKGHFDDCRLWISCRKWPAWVEWPQGGWSIWQYSDVGNVAGAANAQGHVDLDVLAEDTSVEDLSL